VEKKQLSSKNSIEKRFGVWARVVVKKYLQPVEEHNP
jgi:hypothetical protein